MPIICKTLKIIKSSLAFSSATIGVYAMAATAKMAGAALPIAMAHMPDFADNINVRK